MGRRLGRAVAIAAACAYSRFTFSHPTLLGISVAVVSLGGLLAGAPASEATYPGRNGPLAFSLGPFWTETVRPDGGGHRRLGDFGTVSWASTGKRLVGVAYTRGERNRIVRADRHGKVLGTVALPETVPCDWEACSEPEEFLGLFPDAAPALSPDGRTVAFVSEFFIPNSQPQERARWLWTVRTDGSGLRRLRPGDRPRWTPDGRRIIFQLFDALGSIEDIASMRPDGTGLRDLKRLGGNVRLVDVAPSGDRLLLWGSLPGMSRSGLLTSDFRGRHARVIDGTASTDKGSWSPDGKLIAFVRSDPAAAIWVASANGGHKRRVLKRRLLGRPGAWLAWRPLPPLRTP
jgi:Tol biopolymer transport system component